MRLPIIGFIAARLATGNVSTADFAISESMYIIWTVTEVNYSLISTTLPSKLSNQEYVVTAKVEVV